jgi:hypothetical protein
MVCDKHVALPEEILEQGLFSLKNSAFSALTRFMLRIHHEPTV